jgi:hypothetical protein
MEKVIGIAVFFFICGVIIALVTSESRHSGKDERDYPDGPFNPSFPPRRRHDDNTSRYRVNRYGEVFED